MTDVSPTIVHPAAPAPTASASPPPQATPTTADPATPPLPTDRVGEKVAQRLAEKSAQPGLPPPPGRKAVGISSTQFKVLFSKRSGGGSTFGRYQLISELARGSMGIVYRAFDPELKRTVALKVMLPGEDTTDETKARFQREALLAARLHHPNIVQVYDVGEAEGKLFYTMQLVEGSSLQQILNHMGKVPQGVALTIVRDSARAVHHAHEHQLVHRDIKPANLLITSQGATGPKVKSVADTTLSIRGVRTSAFRVLVSDFGIAKDISSQTMLTQAGTVLGTPAYMAPEQAAGLQEKIGAATDTYALGVVLYQLLTGATPFFDPDPIKLLADIIQTDPTPPRTHAPDLHPDLETIILKAIEKDPKRRYPTALALAEDIDRFLIGEMIQAKRRSWLYQRWRWAVTHRGWALTAATLLLLLAGLAFRTAVWPRLQEARRIRMEQAERLRRQADAGARLARAEAAFAAGKDARAAIEAAQALVADYSAAALAGEPLPVADAHSLLARAFAREGDAARALHERVRAWRAALGRAEESAMLAALARDLVERHRYGEAAVLLERALPRAEDRRVRAEVLLLRGRAAEGEMAFAEAAGWFDRALGSEALSPEGRAEAERHLAFCCALARERTLGLPADAPAPRAVDLDGKPGPEILAARGSRLSWGRLGPTGFVEDGGLDPAASEPFPLTLLTVERLHDATGPTVVTGGGDERSAAGRIWLARFEAGALRTIATAELEGRPVAARRADLDGDRRPELVVALAGARPGVAILEWDASSRELRVAAGLPLAGDPVAAEPVDVDEDGRDEIAVFAASGPCRGITVLRWDAERKEPTPLYFTDLGTPCGIARIEQAGRLPAFLVGSGWDRGGVRRRRERLGSPRFDELTPPPGAYLLRPMPDGTFLRKPVATLDWSIAEEGHARPVAVDSAVGRLYVCALFDHGPDAGAAGGSATGTWSVVRADDPGEVFAVLRPRPGAVRTRVDADLATADLDGDGTEELLVATPSGWIALEPDSRAGSRAAEFADRSLELPRPAHTERPSPDDWLAFTRAAEAAHFPDDAGTAYEAATRHPAAGPLHREAGTAGQVRCRTARGDLQGAVSLAEQGVGSRPEEAVPALQEALRLLDERRRWSEAARLGRVLLELAALDPSAREAWGRRVEDWSALAQMAGRFRLLGPQPLPLDWLVDSPFLARRQEDRSWTVYASPVESMRAGVPLSPDGGSWRIEGAAVVSRCDPGAGLRIGAGPDLGAGRLVLEAAPDDAGVDALLSASGGSLRARLAECRPDRTAVLSFDVERLAHAARASARLALRADAPVQLPGIPAQNGPETCRGIGPSPSAVSPPERRRPCPTYPSRPGRPIPSRSVASPQPLHFPRR